MALRFIDGFDHYTSAETLQKWTNWSNTVGPTAGAGRFGGGAMSMQSRTLVKSFDSQGTWIVGLAVNHQISDPDGVQILIWNDGVTNQMDLCWDGLGHVRVRRNGTVVLATGTKVFNIGVWYYVELKIVFDDTVGAVQLKVDGVTDINLTNVDTKATSNPSANLLSLSGSNPVLYDDLYVLDGSGPSPYNDFLGDCRVETLLPNGDGNSSQLLGSDGNSVNNYLLVDEATQPNSDTDYVESATVGQKDTYAYGNLAVVSGTVYAVAPIPWAKKTDAGSRAICTVARLAGTEVDSGAIALPSSYTYYQDIRTTKPGGGAWTIADVNAAEFGVKVVS